MKQIYYFFLIYTQYQSKKLNKKICEEFFVNYAT